MPLRRRAAHDPTKATLVVPDVGVIDVRVRTAGAGTADLEMDPSLVGGLDGREARLVIPEGSIPGSLALGWGPGHVRFTRAGIQRRVFTRVEVDIPMLLVPQRLDGMWRASVRDLSAGGVLIADAGTIPLGARMDVQVELPHDEDSRPVWAPARVVRVPAAEMRAMRFETSDARIRARLQRFVLLELMRRRGA